MRLFGLTLFVITLFFLSSCEKEELGFITHDEFYPGEFSRLHLDTRGSITLHESQEFAVEVRTHNEVMDKIRLSRQGDLLIIELDLNNREDRALDVLDYDIYAPTFSEIRLEGVADVHCRSGFETASLEVYHDGVGDIRLDNVEADAIEAVVNAVGDIHLSGSAQSATYRLDEVGNINAFNMVSRTCDATTRGVGNIRLYAIDHLHARIHGVGDILYKGDPVVISDIDGVGRLVKVN